MATRELTEFEKSVAEEVAFLLYTDAELVVSKNKHARVCLARWLFWLILYNNKYTLTDCSDLTGHADHTPVSWGLQSIDAEAMRNKEFKRALLYVKKKYNIPDGDYVRKKGGLVVRKNKKSTYPA